MVAKLREMSGAGMMDCKKALSDSNGDLEAAMTALRKKGAATATNKSGKEAREGLIARYISPDGRVGVLVEVNCQTDFVARGPDFRELVKEIALHIASAAPLAVDKSGVPGEAVDKERRIYEQQVRESGKPDHLVGKIVDGKVEAYYRQVALMSQEWIRDPKKTIGDLVKEMSSKVGENIVVRRFARFQMGQD